MAKKDTPRNPKKKRLNEWVWFSWVIHLLVSCHRFQPLNVFKHFGFFEFWYYISMLSLSVHPTVFHSFLAPQKRQKKKLKCLAISIKGFSVLVILNLLWKCLFRVSFSFSLLFKQSPEKNALNAKAYSQVLLLGIENVQQQLEDYMKAHI